MCLLLRPSDLWVCFLQGVDSHPCLCCAQTCVCTHAVSNRFPFCMQYPAPPLYIVAKVAQNQYIRSLAYGENSTSLCSLLRQVLSICCSVSNTCICRTGRDWSNGERCLVRFCIFVSVANNTKTTQKHVYDPCRPGLMFCNCSRRPDGRFCFQRWKFHTNELFSCPAVITGRKTIHWPVSDHDDQTSKILETFVLLFSHTFASSLFGESSSSERICPWWFAHIWKQNTVRFFTSLHVVLLPAPGSQKRLSLGTWAATNPSGMGWPQNRCVLSVQELHFGNG